MKTDVLADLLDKARAHNPKAYDEMIDMIKELYRRDLEANIDVYARSLLAMMACEPEDGESISTKLLRGVAEDIPSTLNMSVDERAKRVRVLGVIVNVVGHLIMMEDHALKKLEFADAAEAL